MTRFLVPLALASLISTGCPQAVDPSVQMDLGPKADLAARSDLSSGGSDLGGSACTPSQVDLQDCMDASECVKIPKGCYCGPQPVTAVAAKYQDAALACQAEAGKGCALGCPMQEGYVADDNRPATDLFQIAVRCDKAPGDAIGFCETYVP